MDEYAREHGWRPPGETLLDEIERLLRRYLSMPDDGFVVLAVWILHTHAIEAAQSTPYVVLSSPAPQCGKTVTLELLSLLVRLPMHSIIPTGPALFRVIEAQAPTLLLDETDTIFGGSHDYEALRGVINAGYRRGVGVMRCVGDGTNKEVKLFATFCPKALAGIGALPPTIIDRSLVIPMQRKLPGQHLDKLRIGRPPAEAARLQEEAAAWAAAHHDELAFAEPVMPVELDGRGQDVGEPLVAIADLIGGGWPDRIRHAVVALRRSGEDAAEESLGLRLLRDIHAALGDDALQITTDNLISVLCDDAEAPWGDWRGIGRIKPRALATILKPYGISSKDVRTPTGTKRGYKREQFATAWQSYLPTLVEKRDICDIHDNPHDATSQTSHMSHMSHISEKEQPANECVLCGNEYPPDTGSVVCCADCVARRVTSRRDS